MKLSTRWSKWAVSPRAAMLAVAVALFAGCTSDDPAETVAAGGPEEASFCAKWAQDLAGGDDSSWLAILKDPPGALEEPAAAIIAAEKAGDTGRADEAAEAVSKWVEVHCTPEDAAPGAVAGDRRLALPPGAIPKALTFCSAGSRHPVADSDDGMVLYGQGDDPYSGPMLGVLWGEQSHAGDGDATPVKVRGADGVAAPITVFQQVILEELGTVIAWDEDGRSVGLYGRGWEQARPNELVALAEQLELVDGRFRLPEAALPDGFHEVFAGSSSALSLVFSPSSEYEVRYETVAHEAPEDQPAGDSDQPELPPAADGQVTVSGFMASSPAYEAFRFLTLGLHHTEVGGRQGIAGNAWTEDAGPAVVTWREPDGLVVRLVGLGVNLDTVQQMAHETRELTRPEWLQLVEDSTYCR